MPPYCVIEKGRNNKMKVTSDTKIKTVSEPRADLFDRKVNNILANADGAELIFNSRKPLTVHIVYTEKKGK